MISIVIGEFTILTLQKYGIEVCVILLVFIQHILKFISIHPASLHSNEQQHNSATLLSYQIMTAKTKGLYQGSGNYSEKDQNSNIFCLLEQSQAIQYCNQSLLLIIADLNIFIFSITDFDLILRSALVQLCQLHASYLYTPTGVRFYIFCSKAPSRHRDRHCSG